jgi:hypothetical protein
MTSAEKKSRITQKKSLGQPAGKPRRVDALRKKKDNKEKIMATTGTHNFNLDLKPSGRRSV